MTLVINVYKVVINIEKVNYILQPQSEVINEGIKIDLPESETTRTTIRINKIIWDEFDSFCSENKEFNK